MEAKLKTKITDRWNIITDHQSFNPMGAGQKGTAFAQLEYILIEAGLLAQRRERPSEKAMKATSKEIAQGVTVQ